MTRIQQKLWMYTAIGYLILVATIGVLLRLNSVIPVDLGAYEHLLHAHSHVAFQGWVYTALFVALITSFLRPSEQSNSTYNVIFWCSQATVIGMLISFIYQGYGLYSIIFSSMFMLLSYWFSWRFFLDLKRNESLQKNRPVSLKFIKAALFYLILSSFGPWALGVVIKLYGNGSEAYYNTIYFYLHFQYNGWFTFAIFGLFFRWLENKKIAVPEQLSNRFFWLLNAACIPAYTLSLIWTDPHSSIYFIATTTAGIQLLAWVYLVMTIRAIRQQLFQRMSVLMKVSALIVFTAFTIKLFFQQLSAFPALSTLMKIRYTIIGYLHLVTLGFVSIYLLWWFSKSGWHDAKSIRQKAGFGFFIVGFIGTEIILFLQGLWLASQYGFLPNYFLILFSFTVMMPLGLILWVIPKLSSKSSSRL